MIMSVNPRETAVSCVKLERYWRIDVRYIGDEGWVIAACRGADVVLAKCDAWIRREGGL